MGCSSHSCCLIALSSNSILLFIWLSFLPILFRYLGYKVLKVICNSPYLLFVIDMLCTGVVGLVEKLTVFQKLNHFKLQ